MQSSSIVEVDNNAILTSFYGSPDSKAWMLDSGCMGLGPHKQLVVVEDKSYGADKVAGESDIWGEVEFRWELISPGRLVFIQYFTRRFKKNPHAQTMFGLLFGWQIAPAQSAILTKKIREPMALLAHHVILTKTARLRGVYDK